LLNAGGRHFLSFDSQKDRSFYFPSLKRFWETAFLVVQFFIEFTRPGNRVRDKVPFVAIFTGNGKTGAHAVL